MLLWSRSNQIGAEKGNNSFRNYTTWMFMCLIALFQSDIVQSWEINKSQILTPKVKTLPFFNVCMRRV